MASHGREPKTRHTGQHVAPPSFTKLAMAKSQKPATDICHGQYLTTLHVICFPIEICKNN